MDEQIKPKIIHNMKEAILSPCQKDWILNCMYNTQEPDTGLFYCKNKRLAAKILFEGMTGQQLLDFYERLMGVMWEHCHDCSMKYPDNEVPTKDTEIEMSLREDN